LHLKKKVFSSLIFSIDEFNPSNDVSMCVLTWSSVVGGKMKEKLYGGGNHWRQVHEMA